MKTCIIMRRFFSAVKFGNFIRKIFFILFGSRERGLTLEPLRQFFCIKVGFEGVYISHSQVLLMRKAHS